MRQHQRLEWALFGIYLLLQPVLRLLKFVDLPVQKLVALLARRELDANMLSDDLTLLGYFFARGGVVIISLLVGGVVKQVLQRGLLVVIGIAVGAFFAIPPKR